jgi:hypothetical protein
MAKKVQIPSEINVPKQAEKEQPKQRSVQEIQQEYTGLALRAGQLQYQIYTFEKDLELLNKQMRELNFEAAAAKARDDAEQAKKAQELAQQQMTEPSNG